MKHAARSSLAVSGYKYPDGEHAPGRKIQSTHGHLTIINTNIYRMGSRVRSGVTLVVLPWKRDGFNTQIVQRLAAVRVQGLCDAKVFSS